jgi:DNA-binding NtrC family response regulator
LWADDHPEGNRLERRLLRQMGVFVESVTTNAQAKEVLNDESERISLIITDVRRDAGASGLELVSEITARQNHPPVVLYVAALDASKPTPAGVFGITNRPDALLNLVMDALDRRPAQGS